MPSNYISNQPNIRLVFGLSRCFNTIFCRVQALESNSRVSLKQPKAYVRDLSKLRLINITLKSEFEAGAILKMPPNVMKNCGMLERLFQAQ